MVFKSLLKPTRVQVDAANDGDEGLQLAAEKKYDVIFLDHMMPGKDGIETLHALRAEKGGLNADTPAVCLTANAISGAREEYLAAGFDDYLAKPVDSGKLESLLLLYLPPEKVMEAGGGEPEPVAEEPAEIPPTLAPLEGQDWIDLSRGLENSGSEEAYLSLLKVFYETVDERADELDKLYAEEDFKMYTIKVHALKSSVRLIGAAAFGEEAQKLENAGKSEDGEYIRSHHPAFMETFRSFKAPLAEVFAEEEEAPSEGKPEAAAEQLAKAYKEMRTAADDMDCDRLEAIFAELEDYRIPSEEEELFGQLKRAVAEFDYDTVLTLLQDK